MKFDDNQFTPREFLKSMTIIHGSLAVGQLLIGCNLYYLNDNWELKTDPIIYVLPLIVVIGSMIYKRQITDVRNKDSLKDKLIGFRGASIINYAFIEGAVLLGIIFGFINSNLIFLYTSAILILYFIFQRPTKAKIIQNLDLNSEQTNQFNNSDQMIN